MTSIHKEKKMSKDPYRWSAGIYDSIFGSVNIGLRALGMRMAPPEEGMRVLDVGCGTGVHLELYKKHGCRLYGIDPSPAMMRVARNRLGEDAELHLGEASSMPFNNGAFDLIVCMLVLHEVDPANRLPIIEEMKRVLDRNGRILFIDYHVGPAIPIGGWFSRLFILIAEKAAGRTHYKHFKDFKSNGGLPTLIETSRLVAVQQKIVGGGNLALHVAEV